MIVPPMGERSSTAGGLSAPPEAPGFVLANR
jgi:hypothetical protein